MPKALNSAKARVIDAVWDLSDQIDAEFSAEPDVAAELHHKFTEVLRSIAKQKTGEEAQKIKRRAILHADHLTPARPRKKPHFIHF